MTNTPPNVHHLVLPCPVCAEAIDAVLVVDGRFVDVWCGVKQTRVVMPLAEFLVDDEVMAVGNGANAR